MTIHILQFEQTFKEPLLRAGWQVINDSKATLEIHKHAANYSLKWEDAELKFIKRGQVLSAIHCSCELKKPCKHVAAGLYYFRYPNSNTFLDDYKNRSLQKSVSEAYAKSKGELAACIKQALSNSTHQKSKPKKSNTTKLQTYLNTQSNRFFKDLAIVNARGQLSKQLTHEVKNYLEEAKQRLEGKLVTKPSTQFVLALQEATLESVKNNKALSNQAFIHLVPLLLKVKTNTLILLQLKHTLINLTYKQKYYQAYNPLTMLQYMVTLKLESDAQPAKDASLLEWWIAKAESQILANNHRQAFRMLKEELNTLQAQRNPSYYALLQYAFNKGTELGSKNMQLYFGQEMLVSSSIYLEPILNQLLKLLPKSKQGVFLEELLSRIQHTKQAPVEKIFPLLFRLGKFSHLLDMLKHERQRFHLMHEVATQLLPQTSSQIHKMYLQHLVDSCADSNPFVYHQELAKKAHTYFKQLPESVADDLISEALYRIGKNKPIYHYAKLLWQAERSPK